ncbi:MAG TPA: hypothetical protein VMD05_07780 [Candidatus Nanoarchaeia archaeon]|nr:hypothetical protein [Candidatus Nanoarchaeia archaeon]
MDQIFVGWSTTEVFAVHNLRMKDGVWLVDVTNGSGKKTQTKTIGDKLNWEKTSQLIPEAIFKKQTQQYLKDQRIVSFVRLNIKTEIVDRSKGGHATEVRPTSVSENGAILVNIATGNEIAEDIRRARIRNF